MKSKLRIGDIVFILLILAVAIMIAISEVQSYHVIS